MANDATMVEAGVGSSAVFNITDDMPLGEVDVGVKVAITMTADAPMFETNVGAGVLVPITDDILAVEGVIEIGVADDVSIVDTEVRTCNVLILTDDASVDTKVKVCSAVSMRDETSVVATVDVRGTLTNDTSVVVFEVCIDAVVPMTVDSKFVEAYVVGGGVAVNMKVCMVETVIRVGAKLITIEDVSGVEDDKEVYVSVSMNDSIEVETEVETKIFDIMTDASEAK